ncbi:MAG: GNAT family N-acetyltransferase [Bacteroides sp.]|nr:GNAT family N-acetyltransferase [Bacteroides sp.]
MTDIIIRDAAPEDAGRLLEIYAYYVENTAISFEYEVPSYDEFRARIVNTLKRYPYIAAEKDGRTVGYAYAGPFVGRAACDRSCELTVYVDRAARKRGIGRLLYEAIEDRLKKAGMLNLYAAVAYPHIEDEYLNKNSAEFHEHMGFVKVAEFHSCAYKFGRWYDLIWLEKIIGER